jgi:hypothetical protein
MKECSNDIHSFIYHWPSVGDPLAQGPRRVACCGDTAMTDSPFDELARQLAAGSISRRRMMRTMFLSSLGIGAFGASALRAPSANAANLCIGQATLDCIKAAQQVNVTCQQACSTGPRPGLCRDRCTAAYLAADGRCVQNAQCSDTCCSGVCVKAGTDPKNCGTCGHACATGQSCIGGTCCNSCAGVCCPSGTFCCKDQCVPDGSKCCVDVTGNFTAICGPTDTCCFGMLNNGVRGSCTPPGNTCCPDGHTYEAPNSSDSVCCNPNGGSVACHAGQTCCSGTCIDLTSDDTNCGSCGHICLSGEHCQNGSCNGCPSGQMQCPGVAMCISDTDYICCSKSGLGYCTTNVAPGEGGAVCCDKVPSGCASAFACASIGGHPTI